MTIVFEKESYEDIYRGYIKTYGLGNNFTTNNGGTCYVNSAGVFYYFRGKLHRTDGPASISKISYGPISNSDAAFVVKPEWFVNGIDITHKTDWLKENNIDRDNISNVDMLLINLIWNTQ